MVMSYGDILAFTVEGRSKAHFHALFQARAGIWVEQNIYNRPWFANTFKDDLKEHLYNYNFRVTR